MSQQNDSQKVAFADLESRGTIEAMSRSAGKLNWHGIEDTAEIDEWLPLETISRGHGATPQHANTLFHLGGRQGVQLLRRCENRFFLFGIPDSLVRIAAAIRTAGLEHAFVTTLEVLRVSGFDCAQKCHFDPSSNRGTTPCSERL
ncbi:MAG: hypothetical protein AAAC50_16090 [Rhizobium altiplani]|uniref:hypothetical protein n=1 Tax=Rhizobium altiplani TaxID=1864509 RepID=UPI0030F31717